MECLVIIRRNHHDCKEVSDGEMCSGVFVRLVFQDQPIRKSAVAIKAQSNVNVKPVPYSWSPARLFICLLVLIVIRFTARRCSNYYKLHVAGN